MKLSVRLFDQDESAYLAKVLELASKRARVPFTPASASQADVVFLCAEEPGAHALLNARDQQRVVVVYGGDPASHRWTLPRPATSQNLVPLLDSLQRQLCTLGSSTASADNDGGSSLLFPARHGNHLLERLLTLNTENQPWLCELGRDACFIVDPQSRRVYAPAELIAQPDLLTLMAVRHANPQIRRPEFAELAERSTGMDSMALETFCWMLATKAEPLRPGEQLPLLDRPFRLKRWPGFSQLPHTAAQISMTGALMRHSLSIHELVADGRFSLQDAVQFYNCAHACGLVELDRQPARQQPKVRAIEASQPTQQATRAPTGKRGLFGRILRSLSGQYAEAQPVV